MIRNREEEDSPVFYCTRCYSLHIITENDGKELYCATCGKRHSGPKYIDVAPFWKWERLYTAAKGHGPLEPEPSIYDDLQEVYDEITAYEKPTKAEVLDAGLNYSEVMNRKITD